MIDTEEVVKKKEKPIKTKSVLAEIPVGVKPSEQESLPTLISFNEFLFSMRNSHYIETLGGFAYWVKRTKGIPRKASEKYWKDCLKEFLERKL